MADKRISDLPLKITPDANDELPIVDKQFGGANYLSKKTTVGSFVSLFESSADARILLQKGQAGGLATLDQITGKIPSTQLPSYVDDVLEFANLASFPVTGESGKIYIAVDTQKVYRWSGSIYAEIFSSSVTAVTSVAGKTGAVTLTKSDVGLANVDNTSDANKPISSATQTALDGKAASSHTHTLSAITDAGTAASKNVATTGNASSTQVVLGSDTRLTDARTPIVHDHFSTDILSTTSDALFNVLDSLVDSIADGGWGQARQYVIGAADISHTHSQNDIASVYGNDNISQDLAEIISNAANASNLTSGTVSAARLGSGTASTSTFLRGDGQWIDMVSPANLQVRQGTATEVAAITPLSGEPVWDTTNKILRMGDGATAGGVFVGLPVKVWQNNFQNGFQNGMNGAPFTLFTLGPQNSVWEFVIRLNLGPVGSDYEVNTSTTFSLASSTGLSTPIGNLLYINSAGATTHARLGNSGITCTVTGNGEFVKIEGVVSVTASSGTLALAATNSDWDGGLDAGWAIARRIA